MAKAGLILDRLFETMPAFLAEDYDTVGLLAGSREREVHTVLCALDLNLPVLREAAGLGAELIVTHHPILFRGRKNLCEDDPEGKLLAELVRGRFCLMAMHTNFDSADVGVNDALAQSLGLEDVQALSSGMRMGILSPCDGASLAQRVESALGGAVRRYGDGPCEKIAVMGGSGGDYGGFALEAGADAFVTGEIGYHKALDLCQAGLTVLEAGHAATELPAVSLLAQKVRDLDLHLQVRVSDCPCYL